MSAGMDVDTGERDQSSTKVIRIPVPCTDKYKGGRSAQ
jgi:hypothetical protein